MWKSKSKESPRGQAGLGDVFKPSFHQAGVSPLADARAVGGQIGTLGNHIESGKESQALVKDQIHDVAFALLADQLEGQETAQGLRGGDHPGTWQMRLAGDGGQVQRPHQGDKQEQTAKAGAEGARPQVQCMEVGDRRRFGFQGQRPLVIPAARQTGEALFAHQHRQSIDADGVSGQRQFALDVIDGQVFLAQGDGLLTDAVTRRGLAGSGLGVLKERGAFVRVMAELVAEDAQGVGGVTEAAGHLRARGFLDEKGAESLIWALEWRFGAEKEPGLLGIS